MTGALITVSPEIGIFEARQTMLKERIRHLLVKEGGRLVGIVTDRDIRLNLPSQATSLSVWEVNHLLSRLTVGEVTDQGGDHHRPRPGSAGGRAAHARAQDRRPARARRRAPGRHSHRRRTSCALRACPRGSRADLRHVNQILVVEDEPDMGATYERLLRRAGHRVVRGCLARRGDAAAGKPAAVARHLRPAAPGRRRALTSSGRLSSSTCPGCDRHHRLLVA